MPFLFRPDEDVMVGRAVRMAVAHSLDPLFYVYPPLAFYAFAAAESVLGLLPGAHLGAATSVDPAHEYLAARTVSALAGVGAVGLTWLAAARAYGRLPATLAAAALAVAPIAVREAHFATTDALQLALVALALWAGGRAASARGFAVAGLAAGAAAATKYTAAAVIVYVLVQALWRRPGRQAAANAAAAVGASVLLFAALLLSTGHLRAFLVGLQFLAGRASAFGDMPSGWLYHTTRSLPFGLGPGTYALGLAGAGLAAWRRTRTDVGLLAYLVAAFVPIAVSHEVFFRYVLPLLPALCMLAGALLAAVPARALVPAAAGCALLLLPSLWNSAQADRLLGATDTRAKAAAWLDAHAPPGSVVVVGNYWAEPFYSATDLAGNPLHPYYVSGDPIADSFQQGLYTTRLEVRSGGASAASNCYELLESSPPSQAAPWGPGRTDLAAVFSPGHPSAGAVYDVLDSFYLPIWGFDGIDRPGPAVAIRERC